MRTQLIDFAKSNPDIIVRTELKRCAHPFLRGIYLNDNSKTIGIKNTEPEKINSFVMDLRNQIGRKVNRKLTVIASFYWLSCRCLLRDTASRSCRDVRVSRANGMSD